MFFGASEKKMAEVESAVSKGAKSLEDTLSRFVPSESIPEQFPAVVPNAFSVNGNGNGKKPTLKERQQKAEAQLEKVQRMTSRLDMLTRIVVHEERRRHATGH